MSEPVNAWPAQLKVENPFITGIQQPPHDGPDRHITVPGYRPARQGTGASLHVTELDVADEIDMVLDVLAQFALGPDMEDIEAHAQARARRERDGIMEAVDEAEIGIQPVGRFDRENDISFCRVVHQVS